MNEVSRNGTTSIGANPIIWSNDDFHDLGDEIPLEVCLAEMRRAGFSGSELGRKYPRTAEQLSPILERHDLQLISGWHSTYLLDKPFEHEIVRFSSHLDFLKRMGSRVVIVAECSRRVYADPKAHLQWADRHGLLAPGDWERLSSGLERLSEMALQHDMRLVYHHHMGTPIQNAEEIGELMRRTKALQLLVDTGHLVMAGVDPLVVLRDHGLRVDHVHLKDVRLHIAEAARKQKWSFARAVREGVFTVPGDGHVEFPAIFERLRQLNYRGWLVVEAEQDPKMAPPFEYARKGYEYVKAHFET